MLTNNSDQDQIINYFSWETEFDATVLIGDVVYPNSYNVRISFIPKINRFV